MIGNSKQIISNQIDIHDHLFDILQKYKNHPFQRKVSEQIRDSFSELDSRIKKDGRPVILDSGCGVGESAYHLAQKYNDCIIVGVDKSIHRLNKNNDYKFEHSNVIYYRANLIDFWVLVNECDWPIMKHYLLYPNPWPLKKDVKKRFHAHPIFMELISICDVIEIRSNWVIYVKEFSKAYEFYTGIKSRVDEYNPEEIITPFERKYISSGHQLYKLLIDPMFRLGD